ncbi:exopolysaccharide Pel transporter PelG [bacterium]|jgi:polysaccharide biosynthesis protein PelG|nr:exopolysaccharide Pel transporter PelG [bacterium]
MAGIGFRLQALLDEESYLSTFKAYLFGAIIACGPWIITISTLGIIGFFQSKLFAPTVIQAFRITIVYLFASSLMINGIIQLPLTRYVADLMYLRKKNQCFPTYIGALVTVGGVQLLVGITSILYLDNWGFWEAFHILGLFQIVSFIWIAMLFLSAAKDYMAIVYAYLVGGLAGILTSYILGQYWGVLGYYAGLTLGHFVILAWLTIRIKIEFPSEELIDFGFFKTAKSIPSLVLIGIIYQLSVWIDHFVFWASSHADVRLGALQTCTLYDIPMFLAYVTVIPALAIFLVRTETDFYQHYKLFFEAIQSKKTYKAIHQAKEALVQSLLRSASLLVKRQGLVTLILLLVIPYLIEPMKLEWVYLGILRIDILACFLQVLFQMVVIFLLYFEFRRAVLTLVSIFTLLNLGGSILTLYIGLPAFGYGYFFASFISLLLGILILNHRLNRLEYTTFMKQKM